MTDAELTLVQREGDNVIAENGLTTTFERAHGSYVGMGKDNVPEYVWEFPKKMKSQVRAQAGNKRINFKYQFSNQSKNARIVILFSKPVKAA